VARLLQLIKASSQMMRSLESAIYMKSFKSKLLATATLSVAACVLATPADATLIDHGISYSLTYNGSASYTLDITGINSATDTEGGRYGVNAFAFTTPTGFIDATAPGGFDYKTGGLNSSGCNNTGNFFCFAAITPPSGSALAPGSSLSFVFAVNAISDLSTWEPSFKIDWVGSKNNYDLVSKPIGVPEPDALSMLGLGLVSLGLIMRRRKAA
jgi:PEP-CTERM motif-containing protein